jgi:hypothetical protein
VGRNLKQATIGITLSIALAGVMGCTSWQPLQPTPLVATPAPAPKVVRRAAAPKVVNPAPKPVAVKKVKPVADEPAAAPPVIVPAPLGGDGGGGGGGWG